MPKDCLWHPVSFAVCETKEISEISRYPTTMASLSWLLLWFLASSLGWVWFGRLSEVFLFLESLVIPLKRCSSLFSIFVFLIMRFFWRLSNNAPCCSLIPFNLYSSYQLSFLLYSVNKDNLFTLIYFHCYLLCINHDYCLPSSFPFYSCISVLYSSHRNLVILKCNPDNIASLLK